MERVALVTGGSRGIGLGICQRLLEADYTVAFTCRHRDSLERALAFFQDIVPQDRILGLLCDSGSYEQVQSSVQKIIDTFDRLDILVNNAGVRKYGSIFELSIEDWIDSVNSNINGYFYFTKETLPHLLQSDNPWIFNIGSTAGRVPFNGGIAYNTTKSSTYGFSDSLQLDVRNLGIRVCQIVPGNVFNKDYHCPAEEEWQMKPTDIGDSIVSMLGLPQRAMPSIVEIRPREIPEHPEKGIRSLRHI